MAICEGCRRGVCLCCVNFGTHSCKQERPAVVAVPADDVWVQTWATQRRQAGSAVGLGLQPATPACSLWPRGQLAQTRCSVDDDDDDLCTMLKYVHMLCSIPSHSGRHNLGLQTLPGCEHMHHWCVCGRHTCASARGCCRGHGPHARISARCCVLGPIGTGRNWQHGTWSKQSMYH